MICQKVLPDPQAQRFHSIDLIGHNRKSGETCFFKNSFPSERRVTIQGKTFPGFDGTQFLASLNDPAKAEEDWSMPYGTAGNCTTCHGSHPFLRTVVLSGLKTAEGQPVLPPVRRDTPYKVTAAERLRQAAGAYRATDAHPTFRGQQDLWLPRRIKTEETERTCASCHSVGPENHCEIVLGPAFGILSSKSAQVKVYEKSLPTKVRSTPELIKWHPGSQFGPNTSALEVRAAVDSLMRCCKDPGSKGCKVEPITPL
jgi:hypothetical protein